MRAFQIVNLPPLWSHWLAAFREACRPSAVLPAFLRRFCKKSVPPVLAFVCITIYNANERAFSCKFSCISFLARKFCQFCRPLRVVGCACLMLATGSRGTRSLCRLPSVRRLAWNMGRRATPLPSPRRRSFFPVSASRWWSPSFSVVLLLRVFCWGLWRSFLLRCGGYIRGYIFSLFNRARNKRARTRKGWQRAFPLLCPLRGC